ncbi:uncharacterized protein LOC119519137 [Choloepus didactylus]|uniref:uncharacterized protein LOC119519137 n=1 Tax=Choloepus didactylus TaxID=27675 RepID=UPI0018A062F5|nr:uncharacterized protein LOC119519137 [Choloepus didactylus]
MAAVQLCPKQTLGNHMSKPDLQRKACLPLLGPGGRKAGGIPPEGPPAPGHLRTLWGICISMRSVPGPNTLRKGRETSGSFALCVACSCFPVVNWSHHCHGVQSKPLGLLLEHLDLDIPALLEPFWRFKELSFLASWPRICFSVSQECQELAPVWSDAQWVWEAVGRPSLSRVAQRVEASSLHPVPPWSRSAAAPARRALRVVPELRAWPRPGSEPRGCRKAA